MIVKIFVGEEMVPKKIFTRVDTLELQALIARRIGHQRAQKYSDLIDRWIAFRLSKCEFNKFCIQILGKENIRLHNMFILSILTNSHRATVHPLNGRSSRGLNARNGSGCQKNSLQPPLYGNVFAPPRKGRSVVNRDRKFRDRPSPVGPLGKPQSVSPKELASKALKQQSPTELFSSLGSRPPVEVISVETGEEVEQWVFSPGIQSRSPVKAPLGISLNLSGPRKALLNRRSACNDRLETCHVNAELPDTSSLKSRLERRLEAEGIHVSDDCVNLLNNGLDMFLKRLIKPCIALAASRCGNQQQINDQLRVPGGSNHRSSISINASMEDLRVAMEMNPEILGEDWATQLECICLRADEKRLNKCITSNTQRQIV